MGYLLHYSVCQRPISMHVINHARAREAGLWCRVAMEDERVNITGPTSKEPPRYGSLQSPSPDSRAKQFKVYPGRFYVLTVFTLFALLQSLAWMTFGTIPDESHYHFGLTDDEITLIAGNIPVSAARTIGLQYRDTEVQYSSVYSPTHLTAQCIVMDKCLTNFSSLIMR